MAQVVKVRDLDEVRRVLIADAEYADLATQCRRRGTACRVVKVGEELMEHVMMPPLVSGSAGCAGTKGTCGCTHAETKAVADTMLTDGIGCRHLDLMVTLTPCTQCARWLLALDQVARVWALRPLEHDMRGAQILMDHGVDVMVAGWNTQA